MVASSADLSGEDERAIRAAVRSLVARFDLDYWRDKDTRHAFPEEFWRALGDAGYLGTAVPAEYGGSGLGIRALAVVVETAAASGGGATVGSFFMLTPIFGAVSILQHGTDDQKRKYLPAIASGRLECCMALTEPNVGSETLALQTFARKDGATYVINGQKVWISGVDRAGLMLLVARTTLAENASRRGAGLSLFLVDPRDPAITFQAVPKLGLHTFTSSTMFINDLRVPAADLLGEEGRGWWHVLDTLNCERIVTAAGCLASADLALGLASRYAGERLVFGRPIGSNQGLAFPLARIKIDVELARLMNMRAAALFDAGEPCGAETNMAKYAAAEAGFAACDQAIQTLGGYGYAADAHLERLWRDVRLFKIAPVSQELILKYVAEHMLHLPRSN